MMRRIILLLACTMALIGSAAAQEFRVEEVGSLADVPPAQLKPRVIAFNDHRKDEITDPLTGLAHFADWSRARPVQKQWLALYPGYTETVTQAAADGTMRSSIARLHVYVAEARFVLPRAPGSIDVAKFASLALLQKIDPAIKHTPIAPADAMPLKDKRFAHNINPQRRWCEGGGATICIESRYQLEGKLPMGVRLANKLRDSERKVSEFIEFQSELRALPAAEIDQAGLRQLTAVDAPVTGAIEQSLFWVNQIMSFGKFLAVFQERPSDPGQTVVTAYMVLAIKSDLMEKKKEYENVPVLRNLVPAQVLMGRSSFNTGTSISAGLPVYARNRIKAIAALLERE